MIILYDCESVLRILKSQRTRKVDNLSYRLLISEPL